MKSGRRWPKSIPSTAAGSASRPATVAKCYGQGHWAYGRLASLQFGKVPRGGNNNDLNPAVYERLSGSTVRHAGTRVKIEKI